MAKQNIFYTIKTNNFNTDMSGEQKFYMAEINKKNKLSVPLQIY